MTPVRPASLVIGESKAEHVCLDASSFCPVEHLRSFCHSFPVSWSWECDSNFSRERRFLHLPVSGETVSSVFALSANEFENSLQFLPHHTVTAMATSAHKQAPQHLERTRVSLLSSSFSCAVIAWFLARWAKAAGYLSSIPNVWSLRSCSVSVASLNSLTSAEHVEAQKVLVKQMCRRATHRGSDVRLDTGQCMRPDVRRTAPTDPSCWTWKMLHSWKWKHSGHITELEMLSALTAIRWRARSSSLPRTRFVLFIDNQSPLAVLIKSRSSSRKLNVVARRTAAILLCMLSRPLYSCTDTDRNPADAGSRNQHATSKRSYCTKRSSRHW